MTAADFKFFLRIPKCPKKTKICFLYVILVNLVLDELFQILVLFGQEQQWLDTYSGLFSCQ